MTTTTRPGLRPLGLAGTVLAFLALIAAPLAPAQADDAFEASFKVPANLNEWWVEVKVTGNRDVASVAATVDDGPAIELILQPWGHWGREAFAANGSHVRFVATDADGGEVRSPAFSWPSTIPLPGEHAAAPTVVVDRLSGPNDFALAPNGDIWWTGFFTGDVTRRRAADGEQTVMFHADPIPQGLERGLIGLALDPNVAENGVFYVAYSAPPAAGEEGGGTNRLSRIEAGVESVLLTWSAAAMHNGGRILVAPDGSLFVSTGDNDHGAIAQDPLSPLGKILHVLPDGRPAPGNVAGYVYDLGHRNVYGLAHDPATGRLFATENSHLERDEVNLIEAGANYGWPLCEGSVAYDFTRLAPRSAACPARFTRPLGEFFERTTTAPTGAAVLGGELYWASFNHGAIHRLNEDRANGTWWDEVVAETGGRILDLEAHGSSLYYSNWSAILRLDAPAPSAGPPPAPFTAPSEAPGFAATALVLGALAATVATPLLRRRRPRG